jgi:predicted DNA repair protein MutK
VNSLKPKAWILIGPAIIAVSYFIPALYMVGLLFFALYLSFGNVGNNFAKLFKLPQKSYEPSNAIRFFVIIGFVVSLLKLVWKP